MVPPVLAYSDFSLPFIVATNGSYLGLGKSRAKDKKGLNV